MNEIDFINKWSPNGFENPYQNYCFKADLEKIREQIRAEVIEEFCEGYKNYQTDENICDLQEDCSVSEGWCIDCYKEYWLKENK